MNIRDFILSIVFCAFLFNGLTQENDTLIKRHQIGVMGAYEFGLFRVQLTNPSFHKSIGLGYDFLLNKRKRWVSVQFTTELNYIQSRSDWGPNNSNLSISSGIRVLFSKSRIKPLIELKPTALVNVSEDKKEFFENCSNCKKIGLGYNGGFGVQFMISEHVGISLKSLIAVFHRPQFTNIVRSEAFTQLKIAYAF